MKEYKPTAKQLKALHDGTSEPRKLRLNGEMIMTLMLIHSVNGKSSSTTDHCF